MQLANASAPALSLVAVGPLLPVIGPEEPQAAIATAQLTAFDRDRKAAAASARCSADGRAAQRRRLPLRLGGR